MSKRPDTYHEWRRLYWSLCKELGAMVSCSVIRREPIMTRETYQLVEQIYRVRLRLTAEAEAVTDSFVEALIQAVTGS